MENELMMFYLLPASPNSQKHKLKCLSQAIYDSPLWKINRNPEKVLWNLNGRVLGCDLRFDLYFLGWWPQENLVTFPFVHKCSFERLPFLQQLNFCSEPLWGGKRIDVRKVLNSILLRVKKAHFQMKQTQIILPLQPRAITENPFSKSAGSQEPFISHSCAWPGT